MNKPAFLVSLRALLTIGWTLLASCQLAPGPEPAPEPVPAEESAPAEEPQPTVPAFGTVGLRDGGFTVDGEPFLVVGVGYEAGCRKGRVPWARPFEPELLREDFLRVRAAGFNTIRTWTPMTDAELQLAAEHGLWVIGGIWFDPAGKFADPSFQEEQIRLVEREIGRMAKHPNILCYLLLNEPHGDAVFAAGAPALKAFYQKLVAAGRRADPKRLFSYSNCVITDFIKPDEWDYVAVNVYPYSPVTIEQALGYRTYLEIVRDRFAEGKPLLVTEFGLSVSPQGDGRGYGGNSLEVQRDGVVRLWDDMLNSGYAGGCAFMWTDGWWKSGDAGTHDPNAEEWYGLLETDSGDIGLPRPVYYALQDYNRAIRTRPRDGDFLRSSSTLVEVWAPEVENVQACLDDGSWQDLERQGKAWWRRELEWPGVADGAHQLRTRALDATGGVFSSKSCTVFSGSVAPEVYAPVTVKMRPIASPFPLDQPMPVEVEVRDAEGRPVPGRKVLVARFLHTQWEEETREAVTDAEGVARVSFHAFSVPGIASVAAGVEYPCGPATRRAGDYAHVEIRKENGR